MPRSRRHSGESRIQSTLRQGERRVGPGIRSRDDLVGGRRMRVAAPLARRHSRENGNPAVRCPLRQGVLRSADASHWIPDQVGNDGAGVKKAVPHGTASSSGPDPRIHDERKQAKASCDGAFWKAAGFVVDSVGAHERCLFGKPLLGPRSSPRMTERGARPCHAHGVILAKAGIQSTLRQGERRVGPGSQGEFSALSPQSVTTER